MELIHKKQGALARSRRVMPAVMMSLALAVNSVAAFAQTVEIGTWSGFRKGAASFTFDDGAPSHVSDVAPLFEKYGYKATFFLVCNWNPNWSGFLGLAGKGHEIGSHSNSHPNNMSGEEASSKKIIAGKIQQKYGVISVAYPDFNVPNESKVLQNYIVGRIGKGSWKGISDYMGKDGPSNWAMVPAYLTGSESEVKSTNNFTSIMQTVSQRNGWVAFITHGIQGKNNGNATYSLTDLNAIDGALRWAQQNDKDIWVAPMGYVAMYIKERKASKTEILATTDYDLTIKLAHTIADNISKYDYPLSLRVKSDWTNVKVTQNNVEIDHKIDGGYIYFDAVPNGGDIIVARKPVQIANNVATIDGNFDNESPFSLSENMQVKSVVLKRTFVPNVYSTLILPFAITNPAPYGTFYQFYKVSYSAKDDAWIADVIQVASTEANTPYIFKPADGVTGPLTFTGADGKDITLESTPDRLTTTNGKWTLTGAYQKHTWQSLASDAKYYGFAGVAADGISIGDFVKIADGATIYPFRCYLEYTGTGSDITAKSGAVLPNRIVVRVVEPGAEPSDEAAGGEVVTPVSDVSAESGARVWSYNRTIYIEAPTGTDYQIIDISGRTVKRGFTTTNREEISISRSSGVMVVRINNKSFTVNLK